MNSQTSVKSVWNRIRKIKGKEPSNTIRHLSVNDRDVTSHRDNDNALADKNFHNSSSAFSTDAFTSVRHKSEKQNQYFSSESCRGQSLAMSEAVPVSERVRNLNVYGHVNKVSQSHFIRKC